MKRIAKGFYLKVTAILLSSTVIGFAGVLENLDNELTSLVEKTEPFLVTIESKDINFDEIYVGSGVLVDAEGYVLTTTSVVGNSRDIKVCFKDGETALAMVVGEDYHNGLALLKIDEVDRELPKFAGSNSVKDGSWIIVIGNSYEVPSAVKLGIYSGLTSNGFLQLSVQAGPGSSGSAVFNTRGELIGILVAQASERVSLSLPDSPALSYASGLTAKSGKVYSGLGFEMPASGTSLAVPIGKVRTVIRDLKANGMIKHGYLGIRQKPVESNTLKKLNLKTAIEIIDVVRNSPAEKAGLRVGDILVSLNGRMISSPGHLYGLVRTHKPGDEIKLGVYRDGKKIQLKAKLSEAPDDGYFNAENNFKARAGEMYRDFSRISDSLNNRITSAKDKIIRDPEIHQYVDKLEDKIVELEDQVEGLTNKVDELFKELREK